MAAIKLEVHLSELVLEQFDYYGYSCQVQHLEFRNTVAISSLFDQSSPNLVETLLTSIQNTSITLKKCIVANSQNDGRHHPQFRKTFVISLLFDKSNAKFSRDIANLIHNTRME